MAATRAQPDPKIIEVLRDLGGTDDEIAAAVAAQRVPQRPQTVPRGEIAAPQFGQFIFGYFLTVKG
jgi:hypothetical protein